MPSGSRHSVTMTLRSEPSGFSESTRLPLASRTNKRPVGTRPTDARSDCEDLSCVMFCPFIVSRAANAELLLWMLDARDGTARAEALDFGSTEPELFENLFVVFAERRGAPGRHFRDAVHLNR